MLQLFKVFAHGGPKYWKKPEMQLLAFFKGQVDIKRLELRSLS